MAKTRLNNSIRKEITRFLEAHLNSLCPKETKAKDETYDLAKTLVLEDRLTKWPVKDMRVLEKYDLTSQEHNVSGVCPQGRHITLRLRKEDAPKQPQYRNVVHRFRAETAAAIDACELAKDRWEKKRREVRQDYDAMIEAYRYIDDVIKVWPATAQVLNGYLQAANRNLPVALPEAALKRIARQNLGAAA